MEYCCHVLAGTPSCHMELLDHLQKQICRTLGLSLPTSLEPFAYFGRCSSELVQLVPLPYSRGRSPHYPYSRRRSPHYPNRFYDFSVTIPRCYKDVHVNSFFPHTARLWNSLPIECFPLNYDLNGFKSRIN